MARPHNTPDVFRAIAHPVRRRILELLRKNDMTPGELIQPFHLTQGAMSEHLKALRTAGLIAYRPRKNQHLYSLVQQRLRPIEEWIGVFKRAS